MMLRPMITLNKALPNHSTARQPRLLTPRIPSGFWVDDRHDWIMIIHIIDVKIFGCGLGADRIVCLDSIEMLSEEITQQQ